MLFNGFYEQYIKYCEVKLLSQIGATLQAQAKEKFRPPNLDQTPPKTVYLSDYMASIVRFLELLDRYGEQRIFPSWLRSLNLILESICLQVVHNYTQYHKNITANHTTTILYILLSDVEEFSGRILNWKELGVCITAKQNYFDCISFLASDISNSLYKSIEENSLSYCKKIENITSHYVLKDGGDQPEEFIIKMVNNFLSNLTCYKNSKFLLPLVKLAAILSPICKIPVLQATLQIVIRTMMSLLYESNILVNKLGMSQIKCNINTILQTVQNLETASEKDKETLSKNWVVENYVEHLAKIDSILGVGAVVELLQVNYFFSSLISRSKYLQFSI